MRPSALLNFRLACLPMTQLSRYTNVRTSVQWDCDPAAAIPRIDGSAYRDPSLPDRTSPVPLWAQVSADIRRRVADGAFGEGFPGEIALTEQYDVSRHTIREALRVLRDEGLLRSERGRGTTIEQNSYSQNLGTLYSLFRTIEDQGVTQRSEVRRLNTTTNASVAANLQLAANDELVVLERIRFADDEPLAVDTAWLPKDVAAPLLKADFTTGGLYDALARCAAFDPMPATNGLPRKPLPRMWPNSWLFPVMSHCCTSSAPLWPRTFLSNGGRPTSVATVSVSKPNGARAVPPSRP